MQILSLTLFTHHDLEQMASFYSEAMGIVVQRESKKRINMQIGTSQLSFQSSPTQAYYHFAINIPAGQIQQAYDFFKSKLTFLPYQGKDIVEFPHWQARALYFLDPAGNIVELIARDAIAGTIVGDDPTFLSISEIGCPTEDVATYVEQLQTEFSLPHYDGDRERFSAIGDPEGLLIILIAGEKNWLPTEIPALAFPFELEFSHAGQTYTLNR